MSIRQDIKKYVFIGNSADLQLFCEKAQEFGKIQFETSSSLDTETIDKELWNRTLTILSRYEATSSFAHHQDSLEDSVNNTSFTEFAKDVMILHESISTIEKEHADYLETSKCFDWLGLSSVKNLLTELYNVCERYKYKLEIVSLQQEMLLEELEQLFTGCFYNYIGSFHDKQWYVCIRPHFMELPSIVEVLDVNYQTYEHVMNNQQKLYTTLSRRMHGYVLNKKVFAQLWCDHLDSCNRELVQKGAGYFCDSSDVFYLMGWIDSVDESDMNALLENRGVAGIELLVDTKDQIPTIMRNSGIGMVGQQLLLCYDVPNVNDIDPSYWILYSGCLFFGMIVCDIGYGSVILLLSLLLWYNKAGVKQLGNCYPTYYKVIAGFGLSAISWGLCFNATFFGVEVGALWNWLPTPCNLLVDAKMKFKHDELHMNLSYNENTILQKNNSSMDTSHDLPLVATRKDVSDKIWLEVSIIIGIVHIITSMLLVYKKKKSNLFWIVFLCSAYFYVARFLGVTPLISILFPVFVQSSAVYFNVMKIMFVGAIVTETIQQGLSGLGEGLMIMQLFSDVLSYLRIYALSLAGITIAQVVNTYAQSNLIITPVVFLIGHISNLILGIVSGLIHGFRLVFIEWLHYSFLGEGRLFVPFKKIDRSRWIESKK